jgi:hypothetical protein
MAQHAREPRADGAKGGLCLLAALTISAALVGFPMLAQAHHGGGGHGSGGHGGGGHGRGGWHGSAHNWHGGHWFRGWYGGRFGWWWYVPYYDWYAYYDAPVYPYPAYPYAGEPAPTPNVWYYCQNPAGYYPYVPQCAGPWQPVPASAPQAPPG